MEDSRLSMKNPSTVKTQVIHAETFLFHVIKKHKYKKKVQIAPKEEKFLTAVNINPFTKSVNTGNRFRFVD